MSTALADQPAFPQSLVPAGQPLPVAEQIIAGRGLTVRQHFAAMAMQGLLANSQLAESWSMQLGREYREDVMGKAVRCADELIAALEEKK